MKPKFVKAEQIAFEEVSPEFVTLNIGDEKYLIELDTLCDLAFRSAAFLSYIENEQESRDASSILH